MTMRFAVLLTIALTQATAYVQESAPNGAAASYALFVGSNPGGAQQQRLRYAEDDARIMAAIATQIGGYDPARVRVLLTPTRSSVLAALDDIEAVMDRHAQREEPSRLLFYYSGHARSDALMLGNEDLPLVALRERLQSLPANLTLVILDACQSGAFSRVKGAGPAADFSFNSVQRLGVEGIAVMASSSGTELSQESETLHGSFFTHHLSVGLRGAADSNHDGKVSLDEAYRYAYDRTLAATSATSVGGQHPTFESNLVKGVR